MTGTAAEVFGGRTAVITGAGSGVGAGLARYAATLPMKIVIADVDEAAARRVAAEIAAAGGEAIAVRTDVTDAASVEAMAEAAEAAFGGIDLLVNNAGIEQFGYLWDVPDEGWRRIVDVNVTGVYHGIRVAVPRMRDRGGHIWNLSSVGAVVSIARQAPYLMSKQAVLGLTEALRVDIEHAGIPISVAVVLPGAVASHIFHDAGMPEDGDVAAAQAAREDMLALLPHALDPVVAAERVFAQAAAGEFYLLTQPDYVGQAMCARGAQLASRRPPEAPAHHDSRRFAE
ncbi:SDR family oxidoreductase [Microbacterium sp. CFH 31415]|uniref:SDR family NAD(P)-dependent oxidoreductase n=1 Tax=Microbacterium sp. CFH 31415 TaxID=2921732 RepID=UPI001F1456C0|nr:SDR family oxidoreductase [Microbacterium sp. CFH 31415]MCH6231624.1 SDR family oxidoreductase [Microbacterium sp. CFH 31415]